MSLGLENNVCFSNPNPPNINDSDPTYLWTLILFYYDFMLIRHTLYLHGLKTKKKDQS